MRKSTHPSEPHQDQSSQSPPATSAPHSASPTREPNTAKAPEGTRENPFSYAQIQAILTQAILLAAPAPEPSPPTGRQLLPTRTTPFELALLASVLSLRCGSKPEEFLADAQALLNAAQANIAGRFWDALMAGLDFKQYTFDELLTPVAKSAGKKGTVTLVGRITTPQGLEKALKRELLEKPLKAMKAALKRRKLKAPLMRAWRAFLKKRLDDILNRRWLRQSDLDELNAGLQGSRKKLTASQSKMVKK